MIKNNFFKFLSSVSLFSFSIANASIEDDLLETTNPDIVNISDSGDGVTYLARLLAWVKDEIMAMVWILAVGVFIYMGFKMVTARGNPEEFKKALMNLVYVIVGIFIIFAAWGLVRLVSSITI